jgi:hypothetical protein
MFRIRIRSFLDPDPLFSGSGSSVMLGETNPADSKPGTIRGDFCVQVCTLMFWIRISSFLNPDPLFPGSGSSVMQFKPGTIRGDFCVQVPYALLGSGN